MSAAIDLLVIGGGINGCGIARDAAGRGMSVTLVEQGDLAGATSLASLTQPSEYSKALRNSGFSGLPAGSLAMSSVRVAGSNLRPPI